MTRIDNARIIRAAHGNQITAKSWLTEAPMRMLMNNLDPDVAEKPEELVVYGGIGRAARDWVWVAACSASNCWADRMTVSMRPSFSTKTGSVLAWAQM